MILGSPHQDERSDSSSESPGESIGSSGAVTVRQATARDVPTIRALIDRYVPDGTLLPRSEEFIELYAHDFLVAIMEGRVVGCVHLDDYAPSLAELRSLAVDPAAQGSGIGRTLVGATEELAARRDYATLFAVSNDEAFFRKFGFEPRHIPELDRERSEVSKYKGVYAKDLQQLPGRAAKPR